MKMERYQRIEEKNQAEQQKKERRFISDGKVFIAAVLIVSILTTMGHFAINYYYPDNNGTGMGIVLAVSIVILFVWFLIRNYETWMKN